MCDEFIKRIESIANDFLKINIPISHPTRFFFNEKRIFYKKHPAYEYSEANGRLPIFSVDINNNNASKAYVVTGYVNWWDNYSSIDSVKRYAYEVVLPNVPCHLYVDLEVEFSSNPEITRTIELLFVELLAELKQFLYSMYIAPKSNLDKTRFVVLDSSKSTKFSKHCIIKIPGVMFENNYQCGAFIRRFQLHILNKFGPKESNKYFIYPSGEDKREPQFKQFLIDMGVYTKGRDFRLLGSYKRANSGDKNTKKRFLWLHRKPGVLTDKDFFDTLIQFQPKPSEIIYYVCNMVDTINGGNAMSSSLRTLAPISGNVQCSEWGNCMESSGNNVVNFIQTGHKRLKSGTSGITSCPEQLVQKIGNLIVEKYQIPITTITQRGSSLFYNTSCHSCRIKSKMTKTDGAVHSKNLIYFILFGNSGTVSQSCFNQTYCFDVNTGKHRVEKLFTIRDPEIIGMLIDWCEANNWEWRGDKDFLIPNKWIGSLSDEDE